MMKQRESDFLEIRLEKPAGKWLSKEPKDPADPVAHEARARLRISPGRLVVAGSVRGKKNAHLGKYREDAFEIKHAPPFFLAAVADGAGSCPLARVGARLSVQHVVGAVSRRLAESGNADKGLLKKILVDGFWETVVRLHKEAENRGVPVGELSTTLLVALVGFLEKDAFLLSCQVGDGLIASITNENSVEVMGRPDLGKYADESMFIVDVKNKGQLEDRLAGVSMTGVVCLAMMSDGVSGDFYPPKQRLHELFREIRAAMAPAKDPAKGLGAFLEYQRPGSYDDRTLICLLNDEPGFLSGGHGGVSAEGLGGH